MLRERVPRARIGFFLHIPFPSFEVFRILPWRQQLLEGLLGADLDRLPHVGVRAPLRRTAIRHILGLEPDGQHVELRRPRGEARRRFRWASTCARFEELAASEPVKRDMTAARASRPTAAACCSASIASTTPRAFRAACSRSNACSRSIPSCATRSASSRSPCPRASAPKPTRAYGREVERAGRPHQRRRRHASPTCPCTTSIAAFAPRSWPRSIAPPT